jgi:hypothetical protein
VVLPDSVTTEIAENEALVGASAENIYGPV